MMKKQPTATQQKLIDNGAATRTPHHPLRDLLQRHSGTPRDS